MIYEITKHKRKKVIPMSSTRKSYKNSTVLILGEIRRGENKDKFINGID